MLKVVQNRLNRRFSGEVEGKCNDAGRVVKLSQAAVLLRKISELKCLYCSTSGTGFPPIFFCHLLTSDRPGSDESSVCRGLSQLQRLGKVLCFNLPLCGPSRAFVLTGDLLSWFKEHRSPSARIEKFIEQVAPKLSGLRVEGVELKDHGLTSRDISDLIKAGFLVCIDESRFELTIPCAGSFSKHFSAGRSAVVSALKRSTDQEMLKNDLLSKDWVCKRMKLSSEYHIADIICLGIADSIQTNEGQLLRARPY